MIDLLANVWSCFHKSETLIARLVQCTMRMDTIKQIGRTMFSFILKDCFVKHLHFILSL